LLPAALLEFRWFTRFCYQLDLERQTKFSKAHYVFFLKHGQSFPWPLQWLDRLASWIERRYLVSRAASPGTGAADPSTVTHGSTSRS